MLRKTIDTTENTTVPLEIRHAAIRAADALNTARDCVDEFETHIAKVLPLLHGLGNKQHVDTLDRCDLREVHRMSKLFAGGGQQKKIRRLLLPVLKSVRAAMEPLRENG